MRLPSAPILAVLERAAIAQGYIGRGRHDNQPGSLPGLEEFVEMLGFEPRTIARARESGTITLTLADHLACALKLHPIIVWPVEWEAETLRRRDGRRAAQRRQSAQRSVA